MRWLSYFHNELFEVVREVFYDVLEMIMHESMYSSGCLLAFSLVAPKDMHQIFHNELFECEVLRRVSLRRT